MKDFTLTHHGILGMKWGVRKYQNADGTLTEAGKKRYQKKTETDKALKKAKMKEILIKGSRFAVSALALAVPVYISIKSENYSMSTINPKTNTQIKTGRNAVNKMMSSDFKDLTMSDLSSLDLY